MTGALHRFELPPPKPDRRVDRESTETVRIGPPVRSADAVDPTPHGRPWHCWSVASEVSFVRSLGMHSSAGAKLSRTELLRRYRSALEQRARGFDAAEMAEIRAVVAVQLAKLGVVLVDH